MAYLQLLQVKEVRVLTYLLYGILQSLHCLADNISLLILSQLWQSLCLWVLGLSAPGAFGLLQCTHFASDPLPTAACCSGVQGDATGFHNEIESNNPAAATGQQL
jgi:hypothetical protein